MLYLFLSIVVGSNEYMMLIFIPLPPYLRRQNDEFLIIVAAGNSGNDDGNFDVPNTVGDPAIAKNVIAVGAHNSWGDSSAMGNLGPSYVADFSSRGPSVSYTGNMFIVFV